MKCSHLTRFEIIISINLVVECNWLLQGRHGYEKEILVRTARRHAAVPSQRCCCQSAHAITQPMLLYVEFYYVT